MAVIESINQNVTKYSVVYQEEIGGEDLSADFFVQTDEVKKEIQYFFDEDLLKRIPQPFPIVSGMSPYITALQEAENAGMTDIIAKLIEWETPVE